MERHVAVLVVDDDPSVREIAVAMFERLGLQVFDTFSGEGALALLSKHPEIELLFTDVRMPGMDGISLAAKARALRPGRLQVVLTSGYVGDPKIPDLPFIRKPWRAEQLEALVRPPRKGNATP